MRCVRAANKASKAPKYLRNPSMAATTDGGRKTQSDDGQDLLCTRTTVTDLMWRERNQHASVRRHKPCRNHSGEEVTTGPETAEAYTS